MGRSSSGTDEAAGETNEQPEHTATLIAGVKLDKYEVSVGRFRKFVEGYPGNKPEQDDGQHVGQGLSGWQGAWDTELPEGQEDLIWDVGPGCGNGATWFDDPVEVSAYGNTELRPIVCVSWYVAFAFCAWDGGFLPSEADWEYAAAGGSENRLYPWGDDAPTKNLAAFDCKYDGISPDCGYSTANDPWSDLTAVGTITGGVGRFGHFDLAGNVDEWVMDGYSGSYYDLTACNNCINLTDTTQRVLRGGSYWSSASEIRAAARRSARPEQGTVVDSDIDWSMGFRCARAE
jgi:formylglycine-generating enzyme required for sulfatase activity